MRINVLTIPDCPNGPLAIERIHTALVEADVDEATVTATVVLGAADAETFGMHGSPTFLFDGVDPFAEAGSSASISCRLFRTSSGLQGCPSVTDLIDVLHSREHTA